MKQKLTWLVLGKKLRLEEQGEDHFGRTLAKVWQGDLLINKVLVTEGLASVSKGDDELELAENETIAAKRGIWSSECTAEQVGCVIKGNFHQGTKDRIYHLPECYNYKQININPNEGDRWFCSEAEAEAAGFSKSKDCPRGRSRHFMSEKPPVDVRINNFIQRWALIQQKRETEGKWIEADHGWEVIDRGISRLGKEVSGKDMFETGLKTLNNENGYTVNLGWVLLGQPSTIEYIGSDEVRSDRVLAQVMDAIPNSANLPKADERNPKLYNFLQAINVLLKLKNKVEDKPDLEPVKVLIENIMRGRLLDSQRNLLRECSRQEDMQGTEIAKVFG